MSREVWKAIAGQERRYEVSDQGRVRSLDRVTVTSNGHERRFRGRILSAPPDSVGYPSVVLWDPVARPKGHQRVHILVLETFVGKRPEGGFDACHNNGDPLDNRLVNLRWDARAENVRDTTRHGKNACRNRQRCPQRHRLVPPNLTAWELERGYRACLSCQMGRSHVKRRPGADFRLEADRVYAEIMSASGETL